MTDSNYWQTRFPRRSVIRGAGIGATGLAALLIGCGEEEDAAATPTSTASPTGAAPAAPTPSGASDGGGEEPVAGGRWVHTGLSATTDILDPHQSKHPGTLSWLGLTHDGLLRLDEPEPGLFSIEPMLAESWERPDDLTLVFKVREGAKFHNVEPVGGREITSEDIVYSLQRIATDAASFPRSQWLADVVELSSPDDRTVRIVTSKPSAALPTLLANPWSVIVAREQVESDGGELKALIGSGPFIPQKIDIGARVEFARNPDYWGDDQPLLDQIHEVNVPEQAAKVAAFRAGEIEYVRMTADTWQQFKQENPTKQEILSYTVGIGMTAINMRREPFNDVRVRRAIAHAVDLPGWNAVVLNGEGEQTGPMGPMYPLWSMPSEKLLYREQNLAEAKALASAAGIDGLSTSTITLQSSFYSGQAIQLKEDLRNIGIDVEIEVIPTPDFTRRLFSEQDYSLTSGQDFSADDPNQLADRFVSTSAANVSGYSDPEIDDLFERQARTIDYDERRELVERIQTRIMEDVPSLYTLVYKAHTFFHEHARSWRISPMSGNHDRWNARNAWIKPDA